MTPGEAVLHGPADPPAVHDRPRPRRPPTRRGPAPARPADVMRGRQGVSTMQATRSNTTAVATARGEIDIDTAPPLGLELAAALKTHREVVLDLSRVTFMDCSGLRALDHARHVASEHDSRLLLRGAQASVLRLLKLTGMHRHLTLEP